MKVTNPQLIFLQECQGIKTTSPRNVVAKNLLTKKLIEFLGTDNWDRPRYGLTNLGKQVLKETKGRT